MTGSKLTILSKTVLDALCVCIHLKTILMLMIFTLQFKGVAILIFLICLKSITSRLIQPNLCPKTYMYQMFYKIGLLSVVVVETYSTLIPSSAPLRLYTEALTWQPPLCTADHSLADCVGAG